MNRKTQDTKPGKIKAKSTTLKIKPETLEHLKKFKFVPEEWHDTTLERVLTVLDEIKQAHPEIYEEAKKKLNLP